MAARTARTLILAGTGAGLLTAAAFAYRATAGGARPSPYRDRLPTPERDPFRQPYTAQDGPQDAPTNAPHPPVRRTERPLIPAQRKRT